MITDIIEKYYITTSLLTISFPVHKIMLSSLTLFYALIKERFIKNYKRGPLHMQRKIEVF